jgi:uncharacterized protein (TIGR03067 family)
MTAFLLGLALCAGQDSRDEPKGDREKDVKELLKGLAREVSEARKELAGLRKQNADLAREVARLKRMGENPPPLEMLGDWECTSYSADGKEHKDLAARGRLHVTLLTYQEKLEKQTVIRCSCEFTGEGKMRFEFLDGEAKGKHALAIYELKDGVLKVCWGEPNGKVPAKLAPGKGVFYSTWRRPRETGF